jgi:hypothetical protein
VQEVTKRALEAEEQENIEQLMQMPEPPPDPEVELQMAEFEHKVKMETADRQLEVMKSQAAAQKDESVAGLNLAKIEEMGLGIDLDSRKADLEEVKVEADIINKQLENLDREEDRELQQQSIRSGEVPSKGNQ